ncbi:MAG: HAMP domain-containing protein [Deferribacteres bacterium]|nr:HAMP domain-containing protein [Deferribacteres bacterium]
MRNLFQNPKKSIAAKLIIAIGLLMVTVSFIFWYAILKKQEKDIMSIARKYGNSFVDFAKQSTRQSMLAHRPEQTQQILENLSTPEGVQRVMIYNHEGKILYCTQSQHPGRFVDKSSIACAACHSEPEKSPDLLVTPKNWAVYKNGNGFTTLKIVSPITNEPACYNASCHAHPKEQEILGFVEADLSLAILDEALFKLALTAYVVLFVLVVSLSLGIILYKIVSKPVNELVQGMKKVAAGDLDYSVPIKSVDEMGVLADTFNSMIKDLKAARDQRERWTQTLEEEVAKKTEEIKKTHASLVQTEKLASLGRMAAGVAHEINNPLTGVVTFAHLMKKRFPPDSIDAEDLDVIIEQAERCAKIIKNLLTFARATPSEKGEIDINNVLTRTINLVKNQEKFYNIKFDIKLADYPLITVGDSPQFQQICLNMFLNAADAMDARGTITVATRKVIEDNKAYAEIEFTDTGCGIKEEDMQKLFEPFFTTKPVDKGTGLGLSVSHGIVKHLGGNIRVKSTVGKGTSFFVRLPLIEKKNAEKKNHEEKNPGNR